MLTFNALGISPNLLKGTEELGINTPTPIQEKIIPLVNETKDDLVGLAQTGTGKTAAFGLPIIEQINTGEKSVQALILAPTRELCIQLTKDLQDYSKYIKGLEVVSVYGGANIQTQIKALKKGAHIIVATPGRMLDLMKRKAANISAVKTVVLDEADEMLNMGFREELDSILEKTPDDKRTLLFSATMPREVARIAKNYMSDPVKITIGKQNAGAENVCHYYYKVHPRDRYLALKRIADFHPDIYGLIFCRTKRETQDVADKLLKDGYNADALHGDLSQAQRDYVMKRFRDNSLQMLVATDVAARGLDVNNISHVINYNLPDDLDVYTHRSGRTGRADKSGVSIAIVDQNEQNKIAQLEKIIHKKFKQLPVPTGEEITKKQLFSFIDRMEHVEVDEDQIAPFMHTVNKKLEWLSKEQIVKHFVSLEFNRFLDYYKNAGDLNEKAEDKHTSRNNKDGGKRNGKDQVKGKNGYARFFINVGKKQGITPGNIIGMINDHTKDRKIKIGDIELKDNFSFFEVETKHTDKILHSLHNNTYKSRRLKVEVAGVKEGARKKEKAGKK
ncbi:MAG: DEAD/DEAH box helicase [Bacteroidales bacterium]|nr:DEAD/DEAH box helicase [Bacteroidales bacterium]MBS3775569.1 DEAD/DEAH box helicase [Bacteroidales bacterium]